MSDELDFSELLNQARGPTPAQRRFAGWVILVGFLLVGLASSIYTIGPEEIGVIRRFGQFTGVTQPGLHVRIPFGIDVLDKVPVQRQLKEEFGFRTQSAGVRSTFVNRGYEEEALMLTGDLNIGSVEWIVQYRITDPYRFLFRVRNLRETLRDLNEAVMRDVVGDRTINEVLTVGRIEISNAVNARLQVLVDQYEMGIGIDQVVLQDVNPPERVKPSFNAVNEAQQEREKLINEARADYNRVIPRAKGEAEQIISEAEAYRLERVNGAKGQANRFNSLFAAYRKSPEVTRRRIYVETLEKALPNVGKKVILDPELEGVLPLLNLGSALTEGR
ncbi:MAG: FtsH protease activity modulator HflK [Gemmatimonadetes bacterium]|nr:FtsH protease activity modulator HflK [Gemmatimonadota bacterium]